MVRKTMWMVFLAGCAGGPRTGGPEADLAEAPQAAADLALAPDLHPPAPDLTGAPLAPAIALKDVNPNSATKGQTVGTATLAGRALAVVFLEAS